MKRKISSKSQPASRMKAARWLSTALMLLVLLVAALPAAAAPPAAPQAPTNVPPPPVHFGYQDRAYTIPVTNFVSSITDFSGDTVVVSFNAGGPQTYVRTGGVFNLDPSAPTPPPPPPGPCDLLVSAGGSTLNISEPDPGNPGNYILAFTASVPDIDLAFVAGCTVVASVMPGSFYPVPAVEPHFEYYRKVGGVWQFDQSALIVPGFGELIDDAPSRVKVDQGNFVYRAGGNRRVLFAGTAAFGNRVWLDDGNGTADPGEPGFAGAQVAIYNDAATTPVAEPLSDGSGAYRSVPLPSGAYRIKVTPPKPYYGFSSGVDSVVDANGEATFAMAQDEINNNKDIGIVKQSYFGGDFIAGMVYDDLSNDGAHQPFAAQAGNLYDGEGGVANVTVTAYDSTGVAVASDTTDASGLYTLDLSGTAQTSFRLEFTTLPAGYQSSVVGADNNTSVVFASQGAYVDFGVFKPAEYYGNPRLALTRFVGQKWDFFNNNGFKPVDPDTYAKTVISAAYRADSVTGDYPSGNDFHENMPWATYEQTGAVSGLAYQPTSNTLFTSAFFKANSLYGPQGAGGIYSINLNTGVVSNFLDVDSYFGAGYTGSDIACDANGGSFDPFCFHEVGQQSLGDLDISSDFQTLYSVAIRTDELLAIPVGNPPTAPVAINKYAIPKPAECTGTGIADYVPLGLGVKGATVYVGTACTAQSSQNLAQLRGYIYAFNGGAFTQVLSFPLTYPRNTWNDPYPWQPWQPFSETDPPQPANAQQPWIADIVFDGEDIVFSVADRGGHQVQSGDQSPGGDILRACWTGSAWSLESDGVCDGATTFGNYGYNNQDGPGGGLFYWDQNGREGNTTLGALAQVPGYNNVVTMGADVRETDGMMGPLYINHDTGASDIWSPVFMIGFSNDIWGKGNGMGDLEILYDPAPIELGNRVWTDANGNGIQDPGETPIAGVTVQLWADTDANGSADTQVGTAVTSAAGTYYFVSGTAADPNPGDNQGIVFYNGGGIRPNTAYEVRIPNAEGGSQQAPLSGLFLTVQNAPQPANGNASATNNNPISDVADSDAALVSATTAVIAFTTGGAGANNHGLDVGFSPTPPLAVTLASFAAAAQTDHVLVTWETVSELNNAGFNLYRSLAAGGERSLLANLPSQAPGSTQGAAYSYADADVTAGQTYWYWLEDIDLSGAATLHGPVSVVFQTPTAVVLSELSTGAAAGANLWLAAAGSLAALAGAAFALHRRRTAV